MTRIEIQTITGNRPSSLALLKGVEFAAEGNSADPYLLLRVGKRKGRKSKPVADVPGGPGGQCRWPSQTCIVTSLTEENIRSSGLEVSRSGKRRSDVSQLTTIDPRRSSSSNAGFSKSLVS